MHIGDLVHRMVTSSNGLMNISCDLEVVDGDDIQDGELKMTDAPVTCVFCLIADWRAAAFLALVRRRQPLRP